MGTDLWRSQEQIAELVELLVGEGFVDPVDAEDALTCITRQAERWGYLPQGAGDRVTQRGRLTRVEKERLLDQYIAFSRTALSTRALSDKRRAMGVTYTEMMHWARNLRGPGTLQRARPRSAGALVLELIAERPWMGRRELVAAGVPPSALPGALAWLERTGRITVRRRDDGFLGYALPTAAPVDAGGDQGHHRRERRGGRAA